MFRHNATRIKLRVWDFVSVLVLYEAGRGSRACKRLPTLVILGRSEGTRAQHEFKSSHKPSDILSGRGGTCFLIKTETRTRLSLTSSYGTLPVSVSFTRDVSGAV